MGSLKFAGINNYYWSATTYPDTTNAYRSHFGNVAVHPSAYSNRFDGFSVRRIVFFFPFFLFLLFLPSPFFFHSLFTSPFSFFLLPPSPSHTLSSSRWTASHLKNRRRSSPMKISSSDNVWEGEGRRKIKSKRKQKRVITSLEALPQPP